jgi:hemerythrin-like domain-containing protein
MVFHRLTVIRPLSKSVQQSLQPNFSKQFAVAAMTTISQAITKDHRELEEYYNEVISNAGNTDHQQRYGNQFVWELARHSVGEELVVYPAFEKYLGAQGKQMAEQDRKEHHEVRLAHSSPSNRDAWRRASDRGVGKSNC